MKLLKCILFEARQLVLPSVALIFLLSGCQSAAPYNSVQQESERAKVVRLFIDAYNQKDTQTMLKYAHADIEWIYTDGSDTFVQTSGTQALVNAMNEYWQGLPSARSEVIWLQESHARVAVHEKALWTVDGVNKSQSALSVYSFLDGKIRRVWYFPAEQTPTK